MSVPPPEPSPGDRRLKQQKSVSPSSGGWMSRVKVPAGLVGEKSLPSMWMAVSSLCLPTACALCALPFFF